MDRERSGRLQRLAALLLTLVALWMTLPEHQRQLTMMRLTAFGQRLAARAARVEGHAGMGDELVGHTGDAERRYSLAYSLSRARDTFGRALDSMRP